MVKRNQLAGIIRLFFLVLALQGTAQAAQISDDYLKGYLTSILERSLNWERGSYALDVQQGTATLTLPEGSSARQAQAREELRDIDGLQGLNFVNDKPEAQMPVKTKRLYKALAVTQSKVPLPTGDLFRPLIADPKQPQFFVSYRRYDISGTTINTGAVGFGESFGFYRLQGEKPGDGLQISLSGGLFAQFDLDAPSSDLVNADYIIGLPITYRRGDYSARVRLYHQSSHLGDEYLLRVKPERVNLSYEAVEVITSKKWDNWRAYFGGEYLLHREPANLDRISLHGGGEYIGSTNYWGIGRFVAGLDLKSFQEHGWSIDTSLKAGFEVGQPDPGGRRMRLMAEVFSGYAPHGQFYNERINYYGLGMYFGF
ncbi:DUF1207 domain-containing protein [Sulfurirhabdus autotrophica]|uniref:Uncharacterized protein DUF1207 n=1 Tax=Sulfurirhabdus autotrophica TaxID=1706046 RepID=A0A4R3Y742_9PROT|nr:DUF1207 domain-containing protein [Sulfurirhabdus autotrophica]TCV86334.1 uncharacterized protein DUF1207 [Sulfurirhabdus autotrophica]